MRAKRRTDGVAAIESQDDIRFDRLLCERDRGNKDEAGDDEAFHNEWDARPRAWLLSSLGALVHGRLDHIQKSFEILGIELIRRRGREMPMASRYSNAEILP